MGRTGRKSGATWRGHLAAAVVGFHEVGDVELVDVAVLIDVGGGVQGSLTNRIGVGWDVRRFNSISKTGDLGLSFGREQLSFWRASMALAIRY